MRKFLVTSMIVAACSFGMAQASRPDPSVPPVTPPQNPTQPPNPTVPPSQISPVPFPNQPDPQVYAQFLAYFFNQYQTNIVTNMTQIKNEMIQACLRMTIQSPPPTVVTQNCTVASDPTTYANGDIKVTCRMKVMPSAVKKDSILQVVVR